MKKPSLVREKDHIAARKQVFQKANETDGSLIPFLFQAWEIPQES